MTENLMQLQLFLIVMQILMLFFSFKTAKRLSQLDGEISTVIGEALQLSESADPDDMEVILQGFELIAENEDKLFEFNMLLNRLLRLKFLINFCLVAVVITAIIRLIIL